jgi:hypothetical protein
MSIKKRGAGRAILVGGLIAGVLDIAYAIISSAVRGVTPETLLQSVASGLLGQSAYEGGTATAALGAVLHFAMMFLIAAIFVGVRRHGPAIVRQNPYLVGPLFGVAIYFVMNRVVVPLSAVPMRQPYVPITFLSLAVHMFFIGLVIALAATRFDVAPARK